MHHLTGMDASFLHLETPEMPMHVGSLQILDLPDGYEGDFYEDVKAYVGGRMHLADVFQRKLALMPFELANPVWVDDDELDIDYHVRHVILPRPGTKPQLERYVARLHSSLLDRSRPLWEIYVIEGLNTGQVSVYSKMHHAAIDGQAGVAVAKALLSMTAVPPPVKAPRNRARGQSPTLGVAELAAAAVGNSLRQTIKLIRSLPATARAIANVLAPQSEIDGKRRITVPKGFSLAPRTPLNVAVTNQRAFAGRSLPLAEIKQMAKRSGTSVNDIVMAICAGALKRYLADYGCKPDKPLVAGVPVSLRDATKEAGKDAGNQVSMILVSLATDVADPLERLMKIRESANVGKQLTGRMKAVIPDDFPSLGVPWLMSGLASLYGRSRLANRIPPIANVAISNVPGPAFPLYFAGARLASFYPVSIPGHGIALNMTVQSYNGTLEVGLTACRRAMPDVADLADYVVDEHRKLLALVQAKWPVVAEPALAALAPMAAATKTFSAAERAPAHKPQSTAAAAKPTRRSSARPTPEAIAPVEVVVAGEAPRKRLRKAPVATRPH